MKFRWEKKYLYWGVTALLVVIGGLFAYYLIFHGGNFKDHLQNLLHICAQKNLTLSGRIFCTSSRSVRSRILTYLSGQAALHGSREFEIPFDRQQLADYLSLDRSALSRELCRMRDEGLLRFRKNHFCLLTP